MTALRPPIDTALLERVTVPAEPTVALEPEVRPPTNDRIRRRVARSSRRRRALATDVAIAFLLAILAWPSATLDRLHTTGLDGWETALAMAAHNGMSFGTHVLFTYGPLGFLTGQQLYYVSTGISAFLYTLALSTTIFAALIWSLRRVVSLPIAVAVAYLVGAVSVQVQFGPEYSLGVVLIACVAALTRKAGVPLPYWVWIALGASLGLFGLVKVSLFAGIAAALLVTVVFLPGGRLRALGGIAIGALSMFCLGWFGTGNGFGNLVAFGRGASAVVGGYSAAMSLEDPSRHYTYWLALVVVVVIGLFVVLLGLHQPLRARIGVGLVTALVVWLLFKEGFVRHDFHDLIFFAAAPILLAAFVTGRRFWLIIVGMLSLTMVTVAVAGGFPTVVARPDTAVRSFFSEAATLSSPARSSAVIDGTRRALRNNYALPAGMVHLLRGQTVDVAPWEPTVAWAYPQVRFDPLPVITDYNAYTATLDQLDANYLASPGAPRFILRQPGAIDGRYPGFEPPATQLAIECSYRQVARVGTTWQLLERGRNRCRAPLPLGTVSTGFGHWVSVPPAPPGYAVVARFRLSQGWMTQLESVLYKPPAVLLTSDRGQPTWRFIAASAGDLHVLRPASTLGYSSGFTPLSLGRLRLTVEGGQPTSAGVTVSFFWVREAPAR